MSRHRAADGLRLDEPLAEGEVLVPTGNGTSRTYHTDRDCQQVKMIAVGRRAPRDAVEPLYDQCSYCAADDRETVTGSGEAGVDDCPRCGEEITQLSTHLPKCDGGGSA
jgi:hypothetical protein